MKHSVHNNVGSRTQVELCQINFEHSFPKCGSTVVKVLRYKSEGRWFDSNWCHWNFLLTLSFRSHYGPGVDSASNRNDYQEYFLVGKNRPVRKANNLTTILYRCHEIWELPGASWNLLSYSRPVTRLLLFLSKETGR